MKAKKAYQSLEDKGEIPMPRFLSRLQSGMVAAGLIALSAVAVHAQSHEAVSFSADQLASPGTVVPPYAILQYSSLTGSGNTITGTEIPIVLANGTTVFKNLTLTFNVDGSTGNLTLASSQAIDAPPPIVNSFKAGLYVGPVADQNFTIAVAGPGLTAGGATEWSISTPSSASGCTIPGSGLWYVGPNASSPLAARIRAAKITSTAWSYGVVSSACSNGSLWNNNTMVGVSQIGNTISFVSFTLGGIDYATPVSQITYTLVQ